MSLIQKPNERHSLEAEANQAIEDEARAAAEAVRAKRRTELVLAKLTAAAKPQTPTDAKHVPVAEYAKSRGISPATVQRYIKNEGMPVIPVGSTVRIDPIAADEWRCARGRRPTTPEAKQTISMADDLDVSSALAAGGLRVVGGGR